MNFAEWCQEMVNNGQTNGQVGIKMRAKKEKALLWESSGGL